MALELGLNPKKFGSLDNHKQQPRKEPLPDFIETIYSKSQPDEVKTIEQVFKLQELKREARKATKIERREAESGAG